MPQIYLKSLTSSRSMPSFVLMVDPWLRLKFLYLVFPAFILSLTFTTEVSTRVQSRYCACCTSSDRRAMLSAKSRSRCYRRNQDRSVPQSGPIRLLCLLTSWKPSSSSLPSITCLRAWSILQEEIQSQNVSLQDTSRDVKRFSFSI